MNKKKILISKDAMGTFYLPAYGNSYWSTPNLNELAQKGTVFNRHYTAAPSSAMSYTAMFTGLDLMETKRTDWRPVSNEDFGDTLFDKAEKDGYKCHIVWPEGWMKAAKLYSECYGNNTVFHPLKNFNQSVGAHFPHKGELIPDNDKVKIALEELYAELKKIVEFDTNIFVWLHFPHVIKGRTCYGSDIDLFDKAIGMIRTMFRDDEIYITSDHGNMNGNKEKICYGFDVYEPAARIPLITPRITDMETVDFPTSNKDLYELIFHQKITKREFVYCDSAYYAQPNRKLAIIHDRYKYIYNGKGKTEELYDVVWDPHEDVNIMTDYIYDVDRKVNTPLKELYFYPYWEDLCEIREKMKVEFNNVWKRPSVSQKIVGTAFTVAKDIYKHIRLVYRKIKSTISK